jgi:hypothetical protein
MDVDRAEQALFERSSAAFAAAEGVLPGRFLAREHRGLRVLEVTDPDLGFLSTVTGVRESKVDAVLDVLAGAIGQTPPVILAQADDAEVHRGLTRAGLIRDGTRAMALKVLGPGTAGERADAGGLSIREVDPGQEAAFLRVLLAGYQAPTAVTRYLAVEHRLPEVRRFVAGAEGEELAAAAMSLHHGVAVIGGSATRPQQRSKGAQSALLDRRLREAAHSGCHLAVATVTPGTVSARNLIRAGFTVLSRPAWRHDLSGRLGNPPDVPAS